MIKLNISSTKITNIRDILNLFIELNIDVQIVKTLSTIKTKNNNIIVENGYTIKIFEYDKETFKDKIWKLLKEKFDLQCAFIKIDNEYMGCILNWPCVFTPSNCPKKI